MVHRVVLTGSSPIKRFYHSRNWVIAYLIKHCKKNKLMIRFASFNARWWIIFNFFQHVCSMGNICVGGLAAAASWIFNSCVNDSPHELFEMMTISKLMSSRRRRKYSHVHSLYLHHLLARPLVLLCCHSSKENALNFSRFYEDKWEIKRNEVVQSTAGDENLTFCVHLGSLLHCFSLER